MEILDLARLLPKSDEDGPSDPDSNSPSGKEEQEHPLSQIIVILLLVALIGGLLFFVYNWWKCRQSRVLEEEYADLEHGKEKGKKSTKELTSI